MREWGGVAAAAAGGLEEPRRPMNTLASSESLVFRAAQGSRPDGLIDLCLLKRRLCFGRLFLFESVIGQAAGAPATRPASHRSSKREIAVALCVVKRRL